MSKEGCTYYVDENGIVWIHETAVPQLTNPDAVLRLIIGDGSIKRPGQWDWFGTKQMTAAEYERQHGTVHEFVQERLDQQAIMFHDNTLARFSGNCGVLTCTGGGTFDLCGMDVDKIVFEDANVTMVGRSARTIKLVQSYVCMSECCESLREIEIVGTHEHAIHAAEQISEFDYTDDIYLRLDGPASAERLQHMLTTLIGQNTRRIDFLFPRDSAENVGSALASFGTRLYPFPDFFTVEAMKTMIVPPGGIYYGMLPAPSCIMRQKYYHMFISAAKKINLSIF